MTGQAYVTSSWLAERLGTFHGYHVNKETMLGIMRKHADAAERLCAHPAPEYLSKISRNIWNEVRIRGDNAGFRNAQVTAIAPTGTISLMMDCDTTGIEPEISLIKRRRLARGEEFTCRNNSVLRALRTLGYNDDACRQLLEHLEYHHSLEDAPQLKSKDVAIFDTALPTKHGLRAISYLGQIAMMAAVQPLISGAISKTINLPQGAAWEDIYESLYAAWRSGIKSIAIYRDGSKLDQPLTPL